MAFSLQPAGSEGQIATGHKGALFNYLSRAGSKTLAGAKSALKTLQTARMMSILAGMSDQQLAQIGISRSDIPSYAERLMSGE